MGHIEARDITLTYDTPSGAVPGVHGVSFGMVAVADGIGSDLMDFSPAIGSLTCSSRRRSVAG